MANDKDKKNYVPQILKFVPHDGAFVFARNEDDVNALVKQLFRKNMYICRTELAESITSDHITQTLSLTKYLKESVMLIAWKVSVPMEIIEEGQKRECAIVFDDSDDLESLINKVKEQEKLLKQLYKREWVNWVKLPHRQAEVTVWHILTAKAVKRLKADNCTHIVSLLGSKEKPERIQDACAKEGIEWIWVDIQGANLDTLQQSVAVIREKLAYVVSLLDTPGTKICIHCSAGIHRTGTFAYSLLRTSGLSAEAASELLYEIRPVTARQVGAERVDFVETNLL